MSTQRCFCNYESLPYLRTYIQINELKQIATLDALELLPHAVNKKKKEMQVHNESKRANCVVGLNRASCMNLHHRNDPSEPYYTNKIKYFTPQLRDKKSVYCKVIEIHIIFSYTVV